MDNMYMVLPDCIDNLESLEQWKNKFDQLTYDQRKISNDLSIQKYGLDNRKRYNAMKAKFNDSGCNNCNSNDETENTITSNIVSNNDDQLTHEEVNIINHLFTREGVSSYEDITESELNALYKAMGLNNVDSINEISILNEAGNFEKDPLYIILMDLNMLRNKIIKSYTFSKYSHAAISFDSSLDNMFSFANERDNQGNVLRTGFTRENKATYLRLNPECKMKVYSLFINKDQKIKVKNLVQYYINNMGNTSYNIFSIVGIVLHKKLKRATNNPLSMICSQFVYTILLSAEVHSKIRKDASLISPGDIDTKLDDRRLFTVFDGLLKNYDPAKALKKVEENYKSLYSTYHEDTVVLANLDQDLYYHNDWSLKLSKVIAAEKEGLVIMIDTSSNKFIDEYDEDMINRLKDKWEQLQSLSQNQRNLSNVTALSIFGIDNYNLYTKILNAYSSIQDTNSSVDISDLVSPNPEIQSESSIVPYFTSEEIKNMNIKYSDHSYLKNISEDCTIEEFMNFYHTHGTLSDQYMYANTLEKLYIELENTRDEDIKNSIKQSILELGWNPEIHFSREISKKCNIRHSLDDLRIKSLKESNNIGAFYYSMNQKYNKDEDIIIMAQEILSSK